jgi:hypothetical protein
MPEALKEFLSELDSDSAEAIWEYLDSNPNAIDEMIKVVSSLAA